MMVRKENEMDISEDYCSYEVAKLLRDKGFEVPCHSYYEWFKSDVTLFEGFLPEYSNNCINHNKEHNFNKCSRPTHQLAMKWLREVHAICIEVCRNINTFYYSYRVIQGASFVKLLDWSDSYDTYEQAVEAALKYTLEKLI